MTYDYFGSWDNHTYFNAPMNVPKEKNLDTSLSVTGTIEHFLELVAKGCLTRRQLSLGLAAYGRITPVDEANDENRGIACPVSKIKTNDERDGALGAVRYNEIIKARNLGGYGKDEATQHPIGWPGITFTEDLENPSRSLFAYRPSSKDKPGLLLSYDDTRSLREKVRYALAQGLGGVMIWDLAGDLPMGNPESLISAVADELRQTHPSSISETLPAEKAPAFFQNIKAGRPLAQLLNFSETRDYGSFPKRSKTVMGGDKGVHSLITLTKNHIALARKNAMVIMAPLPDGGFITMTDESIGIWGPSNGFKAGFKYEIIQRFALIDPCRQITVLNNGNIIFAADNYLEVLTFPGWPKVMGGLQNAWHIRDETDQSVLHLTAGSNQSSNLKRLLTFGAPPEQFAKKATTTPLAEALKNTLMRYQMKINKKPKAVVSQ